MDQTLKAAEHFVTLAKQTTMSEEVKTLILGFSYVLDAVHELHERVTAIEAQHKDPGDA